MTALQLPLIEDTMTCPRKELVSIDETPYYHITARCVRRSYLCGVDPYTQISYEHRRQWIVERIRLLSSVFAIGIAAYAVMSNHYHWVVKLSPEQVTSGDLALLSTICST